MKSKIIKVIVDELPESCSECQFINDIILLDFPKRWCMVTGKNIDCDSVRISRPDWCPLVTMKRLLKLWEYAETGNWDYESGAE